MALFFFHVHTSRHPCVRSYPSSAPSTLVSTTLELDSVVTVTDLVLVWSSSVSHAWMTCAVTLYRIVYDNREHGVN